MTPSLTRVEFPVSGIGGPMTKGLRAKKARARTRQCSSMLFDDSGGEFGVGRVGYKFGTSSS